MNIETKEQNTLHASRKEELYLKEKKSKYLLREQLAIKNMKIVFIELQARVSYTQCVYYFEYFLFIFLLRRFYGVHGH